MKKIIQKTGDGSSTLHIPEWNEQYHSTHGALAEAKYVFISKGLEYQIENKPDAPIKVLEIGFGTGLNVLLTKMEAEKKNRDIDLTTIEAYPLSEEDIRPLNYPELLNISPDRFFQLHKLEWEKKHKLSKNFSLTKHHMFFSEITFQQEFDLIYFDAFGMRVQPELWTEEIFQKMYNALKHNGVLVTYASNGNARRGMQKIGFTVERLPGPPGKRHMTRAFKN